MTVSRFATYGWPTRSTSMVVLVAHGDAGAHRRRRRRHFAALSRRASEIGPCDSGQERGPARMHGETRRHRQPEQQFALSSCASPLRVAMGYGFRSRRFRLQGGWSPVNRRHRHRNRFGRVTTMPVGVLDHRPCLARWPAARGRWCPPCRVAAEPGSTFLPSIAMRTVRSLASSLASFSGSIVLAVHHVGLEPTWRAIGRGHHHAGNLDLHLRRFLVLLPGISTVFS